VTRTDTILTLANRTGINLLGPKPEDIDFHVIAEHLSKENRYNGATPGVCYSVAEHSVRGATAILEETGDRELAAYFLLHDGHEAFLKDDTTPKKRAVAAIAEQNFGVLASSIAEAFDILTHRFDVAIHTRAGLAWPPTHERREGIKYWDLRMFVTEWRDLMGNQPHPNWERYSKVPALGGNIIPLSWDRARDVFLALAFDLLPGECMK
jgi:hypothetical protein